MFPLCTPLKHQDTSGFLIFFFLGGGAGEGGGVAGGGGAVGKEHLPEID